MILLVGAQGFLGRRLVKALEDEGLEHLDASHGAGADVQIDLNMPVTALDLPRNISHAVILSSITSVDECLKNPQRTEAFNVTHTCQLITALTAQNIVPVFISSDLVFEGRRGNYSEREQTEPGTAYGKQKRAVEEAIKQTSTQHLIVRLGKLYTLEKDDNSPVSGLVKSLRQGEAVKAAIDQFLTPTVAEEVAQGIVQLIHMNAQGAFHLTPTQNGAVTRYEMAVAVADAIGADPALITKCSIDDFSFAEPRPKNSTLNGDKFQAFTNMRLTPFIEMAKHLT